MESVGVRGGTKANQPSICMKISISKDPFTLTAASLFVLYKK